MNLFTGDKKRNGGEKVKKYTFLRQLTTKTTANGKSDNNNNNEKF